jgi:hypothetical protein
MKIKTLQQIEDLDWEFYDYALDLEKEWRRSLPRFTDKELLEIFPEAKTIIPEKIVDWIEERDKILDAIKKKLTLIKYRAPDEFSRWFWREWVKVTDGEELLKIDGHIVRLERLQSVAKGRTPKGRLTEEEIQQALAVPIENLINQPLRKSGKALVGLCPFHNERHPSFYVYPETNSCWCYGCNQGGNVINFVELLHGYSFKEAVKYLIGK